MTTFGLPYEYSSCSLNFAQRQGFKWHNKDKHELKRGCSFCAQFTCQWSQGRRYVYRRHLPEEHPGVVLPSLDLMQLQLRADEASTWRVGTLARILSSVAVAERRVQVGWSLQYWVTRLASFVSVSTVEFSTTAFSLS